MQNQTPNQTQNKAASSAQEAKDLKKLDIVSLIKEDHKPLKELIKILKDSDKGIEARQDAFAEFAPLLVSHAKPEEQVLYVAMKNHGDDLREEGYEGDVEHQLADQMVEEIMRTTDDQDLWSARVKVLAELVEHHIQEEEEEMLPNFEEEISLADRAALGNKFLQLKTRLLEAGGLDTVPEAKIEQKH